MGSCGTWKPAEGEALKTRPSVAEDCDTSCAGSTSATQLKPSRAGGLIAQKVRMVFQKSQ